MPAPLLSILAFTGLLGGRELVQRRGANRRGAANQAALDALSGGGQLGFNGMGPPTRVGTGQTVLDDEQIAVTQAMSMGDPSAALAQALGFAETNRVQENFDDQLVIQNEDLSQRKQAHSLAQDRFNLDRQRFQLGKDVSAAELAEANRAIRDPVFAAQRAARDGQKVFSIIDSQTGAPEVVPLRGTADFNARVGQVDGTSALLQDINRLRTLAQQVTGPLNPDNPVTAELASLHTSVLLQLKDAFELGALSGDDIRLVLARFPDPTAVSNVLGSSPETIDQAFSSVSQNITQELTTKLQGIRNFQGVDPRILGRAQQSIFGAQAKDAEAQQRQTESVAAQAQAQAIEGSHGGDVLSMLLNNDPQAAARIGQRQQLGTDDLGVQSLINQAVTGVANNPLSVAGAVAGIPLLGKFLRR